VRHNKFGATGVLVPVVGQGTWKYDQVAPGDVSKVLRTGIDVGMTHIDTAEMYGSGKVEELVGRALEGHRDEVFLASKVLPYNADYKGTIRACEESLRRLRTDRLDLYMLHWPGRFSLARTLDAFRKLQNDGKILHFGVSNFDVRHLEKLDLVAAPGEIACNQVWYSLRHRSAAENRVAPACADRGISLVAYSPLESGKRPGARRSVDALDQIAAKHQATRYQIALAFLLSHGADFVIPRSADASHTRVNAAAGRIKLSQAETAIIDRAFPARFPPPRSLPITTDPWF
jgi:diketogulonate reductase-like aldo/keto reductase